MKIQVSRGDWRAAPFDLLILGGAFEDPATRSRLPETGRRVWELLAEEGWKDGDGACRLLYGFPGLAAKRVLLVGLGNAALDRERLRKSLLGFLLSQRFRVLDKVGICLLGPEPEAFLRTALEAVLLLQEDVGFLKTEANEARRIEEISLECGECSAGPGFDPDLIEKVLAGVNLARRLTHLPGNRTSPAELAELAADLGRGGGLEVRVWDERSLAEEGFGAILAVGCGSSRPPQLVSLRYVGAPERPSEVTCLVGKGVVFDAGGLSLKPAQSMEEMKGDKAGACSVLGTMQVLAAVRPRCNVLALLPLAENLPGGRAQRPGDVIRTYSGKTVEVINTDAEGRLLLADALGYATREFKPREVIDLATLTGAVVVALGHVRAGLFANDETLAAELERAGGAAGERLWRMPLDPDYFEELKSPIADVKNIGSRWGGAVTAAKFLEFFVEGTPWAHIDMAGKDLFDEKRKELGPSGFGVMTLVEWILQRSSEN
ncbi:MAG: leucyl aminopeptidase [Acidobacteriota bacterium]